VTQYSGLLKIIRFNWPWYAGAIAATAAAVVLIWSRALHGPWAALVITAFLVSNFWLVLSLCVSHYVYDCSPVSRGGWLERTDPVAVRKVAVFHAGQDEASHFVARALPLAQIQTFDFYDPARTATPSLKRARALAERDDPAIASDKIPLENGTLDLGLVVFAAHEIREDRQRASFFRELARALATNGRIVIVEHLRDGWNFLAYGPGAFHFLSAQTWRRSFVSGGLTISSEKYCTRFVRVFELRKGS
jgi:hypothetical protein